MNIYLFGMICGSNSFKLSEFPVPDEYSEIQQYSRFPGGETGTCATVLASLGANVKLDGTHIGSRTAQLVRDFYRDKPVDLSLLTFDESFEGLEDYILISGDVRTPFGTFGRFFSDAYERDIRRWNAPDENSIAGCDAAAVDAFFGEESRLAAELCVRHRKPYVTIDCKYDSFIHGNAAVTVISGEFIGTHYKGMTREELYPLYAGNSSGLTVITNGGRPLLYGRRGEAAKYFEPFKVDVVSTLGAGDTFKAGCTYALARGMSDGELVEFASACSGAAVSRFPMQEEPPTLREVENLIKKRRGIFLPRLRSEESEQSRKT